MFVRKFSAVFSLLALSVVASATHPVSASAPLPAGAGDFVPTIDLGSALADLSGLSSTPCKVGSSNIAELSTGDSLTLPSADLAKAYAVATALKNKSDSLVSLSCTASMTIAGQEKEVKGTISNPALGLSGSFTLRCTFKQDLQISADLGIGSSLARGATVAVRSADKLIPVTCSMAASFSDGTSVSGSIDGTADVGNIKSDSCTGDTQLSCVPLSVSAKVTVTSTTGKLSGYTGTGTYDLKPSFTIPSMNANLAQLQSAIGKSSVRSFSSTPRMASKEGSLKIAFTPGSTRTDIVYPAVASDGTSVLGTGSLLAAVGPRSTKCSYAVARGKKTVSLVSVSSSTEGVLPTRELTKKQYDAVRKGLGAKSGSPLTFVVTCGKSRATQTVTLG